MWLLKGNNNGNLIYLKPNTTMIVGRNKGDIVLSEDGSISRVHAQIIVESALDLNKITEKTQPVSKCTIKDPGSKYGNFVLKDDAVVRISEEGYDLQHMDCIRFGLQNYIFTVHYIPIITATSGMSEEEKEKLKKVIDAIDGKITYVWSSMCTHMTVEKPTISEKLSCALVSQTPIVNMDYWDCVTRAFKKNNELPEPAMFASFISNNMQEIGDISVVPNPVRKTLFKNLTFVHFNSKQFAIYVRMIKLAQGKSILYGKQQINFDVCDDNIIVVQLVESNTTQATGTGDANYAAVCEKLGKCRRRTIPESEIALAILHCSTDKYCNPKFDYALLFARCTTENQPKDTTVLALDTQDVELQLISSRGQVNKPSTAAKKQTDETMHCIPETVECAESQIARPYRKNHLYDPPNYSIPTMPSQSVNHSIMDELQKESEIGSMKLASLNHDNYLKEEFNKKTWLNEISRKRDRDREDVESVERKKKVCLRESPIDKESKPELRGPSKLDRSYEEMMPDDEDIFFMNEEVSSEEKILEMKQEGQNFTRRLSAEKEIDNVDMSGRRGGIENFDLCVEDAISKPSSSTSSSQIKKDSYRTRIFETKERKPLENSTTDENERPRKRKVARLVISPSSEVIESVDNRIKSEVTNKRQNDLPSPSSNCPKKNLAKETIWVSNTTIDSIGPKKDFTVVSDKWKTPLARDYGTSEYFKFPNDPNSTMLPLLRIKTPADIYTNGQPRFGKCFHKQKITIPNRIELDGSSCIISSINKQKSKKNVSFDNEEKEEAATPHIGSLNNWSRAKKCFKV